MWKHGLPYLAEFMNKVFIEKNLLSLAMIIIKQKRQFYGFRNKENILLVTPNKIFGVASIIKYIGCYEFR